MAAAIRSAAATAATVRSEHDASLVWTGPSTDVAGLRSTRSVLHALVANATQSLVLVSFATYHVAGLTERLADAIGRGVKVSLILETPDDPGGPLTFGPDHAFEQSRQAPAFTDGPKRRAMPSSPSPLDSTPNCVIADRSLALITSANLTSAGINDNIELGVLIEAGPCPSDSAVTSIS